MNPIPLPWMLGGTLALALLGGLGGYHLGAKVTEADFLRAELKDAKDADKRLGDAKAGDAQAAVAEVARQTTIREITREVPQIIDRPVYRNVCVDADGLRLLSRAVEAANGGSATVRTDGGAGQVRPAPDHGGPADAASNVDGH